VDYTTPSEEIPNLEDSFTKALRDRPEVVQSAAQIDSSKAGLTLSRLQALPVPTATAGYEGDLNGGSFGRKWNIGIGLTMSLFDGGALAAGVTSSRASLQSSKLADSQLRKDISTEVEQAYLDLTSALQRLEASKPNVALAQKNLEVAREKYVQGMAIPLEIVNAQTSYADALASNAQALYDSYVARAQLDNAVGKRGY
jgi:outer membrane protein TolC